MLPLRIPCSGDRAIAEHSRNDRSHCMVFASSNIFSRAAVQIFHRADLRRIVLTLNLLFLAATAAGIFLVGEELVGTRAAAIAAWIWVFWYYCAVFLLFLDETSLCALLFVVGLWGLLRVERSRRVWQWAAFGIFWSFCCLVSPAFFSILACYWLWLWIRAWREDMVWRRGIRSQSSHLR